MSSGEQQWRQISSKYNIKAVNLFAEQNWSDKITKDFDVQAWPHSILIDQNGRVVQNKSPRAGSDHLAAMIDSLLREVRN
jgi:hypothetical protein